YIVVSFINATLVLSIGESVEEVQDSGLLTNTPTLFVQQMGDDTLIQAHPEGVRHILADKRVNEWKPPAGRLIVCATANNRQAAVALNTGELVYFELDANGQLNEYQERVDTGVNVLSLALGIVPEGRMRFRFLAVGCDDQTVRIFCLEPERCLEELAIQALNSQPDSLAITSMMDRFADRSHESLFLGIGMRSGVLLRTVLDSHTGEMTDPRMRFLGSKPVKLFSVSVQQTPALLALSSRPWLSYTFQARSHLVPLSYSTLEFGAPFFSEQCPEGMVAISENTLRIIALEKLGGAFNQAAIPLKYTPRRFAVHPVSRNFVVIESDHATYSPFERERIVDAKSSEGDIVDQEVLDLPPETFGNLRAPAGKWASCIRILSPFEGTTLQLIELDGNEAALCVATVVFHSQPESVYLAVGTAVDMTLSPRSCSKGYIRLYKFSDDGGSVELVHQTEVADIPQAMHPFHGRLLVGVGSTLRVYDLGKRKLLRKAEAKGFPTSIVALHTQGNRVIVGDMQESVHYVSYRPQENRLLVFADDTAPRLISATEMLDYDTVVGGDRFGNLFVNRLPRDISDDIEDDPTGNRLVHERGYLHGSAHKVQALINFYIGDTITSIHKATLVAGGREIILYTTITGAVGVAIPFTSRDDVEFFQTLEMHMRSEASPLCGRDHLSYRSAYMPAKNVVDGDLCERFNALTPERKQMIAEELDRTPNEVAKKLEDIRTMVAF
ncbi:CPSF A subunit region-domain-containing protein, partial [Thamnocephalis sphaerospora]